MSGQAMHKKCVFSCLGDQLLVDLIRPENFEAAFEFVMLAHTSVYIASAPLTSDGFVDHSTGSSGPGPYFSGQIALKRRPASKQACHSDRDTLFQSPT